MDATDIRDTPEYERAWMALDRLFSHLATIDDSAHDSISVVVADPQDYDAVSIAVDALSDAYGIDLYTRLAK